MNQRMIRQAFFVLGLMGFCLSVGFAEEPASPDPAKETAAESFLVVRQKAAGRSMDVLTTKWGEVYRHLIIQKVDDDGVQITQSSGVTRIPFFQLPQEMQKEFGCDLSKDLKWKLENLSKDDLKKIDFHEGRIEKLLASISSAYSGIKDLKREKYEEMKYPNRPGRGNIRKGKETIFRRQIEHANKSLPIHRKAIMDIRDKKPR